MDYSRAVELVREAGRIVFSEELRGEVSLKGDSDFVTAVDTGVSAFLKSRLRELDASAGFFSEEESGGLCDPGWILDPVDGTSNLVYGYRFSSVSLAFYKGGAVDFGVVYNPYSGECFTAKRGEGAWLGEKRLCVSRRGMKDALVEFGAGVTHKENAERNFRIAKEVFMQCVDIRRVCSSALDLCYIADGRIDGYFEESLKPWDIAAGSLILEEAGGEITDYAGRPVQFSAPTSVIAGNGLVNRPLAQIVRRAGLQDA